MCTRKCQMSSVQLMSISTSKSKIQTKCNKHFVVWFEVQVRNRDVPTWSKCSHHTGCYLISTWVKYLQARKTPYMKCVQIAELKRTYLSKANYWHIHTETETSKQKRISFVCHWFRIDGAQRKPMSSARESIIFAIYSQTLLSVNRANILSGIRMSVSSVGHRTICNGICHAFYINTNACKDREIRVTNDGFTKRIVNLNTDTHMRYTLRSLFYLHIWKPLVKQCNATETVRFAYKNF